MSPPAAQLKLSGPRPSRKRTDHEREAQMNREAQDRWRGRQYDKQRPNTINPRVCYTIEIDSGVLDMLVDTGQILDHETSDPKIVGETISEMLAEAVKAWKAGH